MAPSCGLAFDQPGGPLVAVCGLVGGSGASTLAYCLSHQAARESAAPVLLAEAGDHRAGLAAIAGRATPHALGTLARRVAAHDAPERTFAELKGGLRLIASLPGRDDGATADDVRALLDQARAAHGLVVVDCALSTVAGDAALSSATHIVWVLPATALGVARARMLFASDTLVPRGTAPEALAAVALTPGPRPRVRALRRIASVRCERLVLIPYSPEVARGDGHGDEPVLRAITGLAPMLRTAS